MLVGRAGKRFFFLDFCRGLGGGATDGMLGLIQAPFRDMSNIICLRTVDEVLKWASAFVLGQLESSFPCDQILSLDEIV